MTVQIIRHVSTMDRGSSRSTSCRCVACCKIAWGRSSRRPMSRQHSMCGSTKSGQMAWLMGREDRSRERKCFNSASETVGTWDHLSPGRGIQYGFVPVIEPGIRC